jgi:cobalt/nickel transport system permease protein
MILAVHIADGVLRPDWWAGTWLLATALIVASLYRLNAQELPRLAMATALFFVASSVHLPVGGVSVHLLLTGLVGVIAGWRSGLVVAAGLFLQSRLIGHGGLLSLGFNIVIMAVPAIIVGAIYSRLAVRFCNRHRWQTVFAFNAGCLGVALTVGLGFAGLRFGTASEIQPMTWTFVIAHVPIMAIEGLLSAAVLTYLSRVRPEPHWIATGNTSSSGTSH